MKNYYTLPKIDEKYIRCKNYFLLFETKLCDNQNYISYLFVDPVKIIKARNFSGVRGAFKDIEKYSQEFYLAGYFAYELGYYFEREALGIKDYRGAPLIHLGVFDKALYFDHRTGATNIKNPGVFSSGTGKESFNIRGLKLNISPGKYRENILKIKDYIRRGDTYQVNFTSKYNFKFSGSAFALYRELAGCQRVQYGAFCKLGGQYVLSLSPELFFKREGSKIFSQPMKGTVARGMDLAEDRERIRELKESSKNRAENLMIVDLVRNDLGRISQTGTVRVAQAFKIRKYDTIFQMTSEVKSLLRKGVTYYEIFKDIFPGGSVTGAPKIRTMQIIRELESGPRGVYCGALGMISPGDKAALNLPIRTLSITGGRGEMGVGSGIVYDSSAGDELAECRLKADFLSARHADFKLIETLGWDKGYKLLGAHLKRLKSSAGYFDFAYDPVKIRLKLKEARRDFSRGGKYRVRLLLSRDGGLECASSKVIPEEGPKYAVISGHRVKPGDIFLRHKTTNRRLYDQEYARYSARGYFDVIFMNTEGKFTEGAISNIIIEKKGKFYTPPLSCGVLPGIYRGCLIKKGIAKEKIISRAELSGADRVFLCNSVRGMVEVRLQNSIRI